MGRKKKKIIMNNKNLSIYYFFRKEDIVMKSFSIVLMLLFLIIPALAQSPTPATLENKNFQIQLSPPQMQGGMPLMEALSKRRSSRTYSDKELPNEVLSNLMWAAFGINRVDNAHRTAPSAYNMQEIDVYVALASGLYLYDAKEHVLKGVHQKDIRALTGAQEFVANAPVNLIFVADISKMDHIEGMNAKDVTAAADASFISENVYLYCASEGLATVVRGWVDKESLALAMNLKENQKVVFAQSVGYGINN